jgi:hypothetical protein
MQQLYKLMVFVNLFMAIINVIQGVVLESGDHMLIALLNLTCAFILSNAPKEKK